MRQALK